MSGPAGVAAPVSARFLAFLLDIALLTLAMALLPDGLEAYRFGVFLALAFLYFGGLPASGLRGTLGKWVCRIRLSDRGGRQLGWPRSALRAGAMLAWWAVPIVLGRMGPAAGSAASAFWFVFFLPWALAGLTSRHESLFDLIAGSLVVRLRAEPQAIAESLPVGKPGVLRVAAVLVPCVFVGFVLSTFIGVNLDRNLRARVGYAIEQTKPLQEKLADFNDRERRWPDAAALDVPEWTSYRDGGGYRLKPGGVIEVSFSVLPELKGHVVTLRPRAAAPGDALRWGCSSDAEFARMLPAICRE